MNVQAMMAEVYAAFNRRDVDGVLAWMTEDVSWPKASEGGRVVGKAEIRAYWMRQWSAFDPRVEVLEVVELGGGRAEVRVRQVVRSLAGNLLADEVVWHGYGLRDGLIARMELGEGDGRVSAAFGG